MKNPYLIPYNVQPKCIGKFFFFALKVIKNKEHVCLACCIYTANNCLLH